MSLADKLNYTIAAKLDVQQACIYQGVDLPDNAPLVIMVNILDYYQVVGALLQNMNLHAALKKIQCGVFILPYCY